MSSPRLPDSSGDSSGFHGWATLPCRQISWPTLEDSPCSQGRATPPHAQVSTIASTLRSCTSSGSQGHALRMVTLPGPSPNSLSTARTRRRQSRWSSPPSTSPAIPSAQETNTDASDDDVGDVMGNVVNKARLGLLRGDIEAPSPSPQLQPRDTAPLNRVVEATPEATSPRGQHPPQDPAPSIRGSREPLLDVEEDILEADYTHILDHGNPPPTLYPIPANGLPSLQTAHRTHVTTTTHVP